MPSKSVERRLVAQRNDGSHECPTCDGRCWCADGGLDIEACQHCVEEPLAGGSEER